MRIHCSRRDLLQTTSAVATGLVVGAGSATAIQSETVAAVVSAGNRAIYAVDPDGNSLWTFSDAEGIVFTGPTVVDGRAYVGDAGGRLFAIDVSDGSKEWAFDEPDDEIRSSATVVGGGRVFVGADDGTVYAVDAASGTEAWRFSEPESEIRGSPAVADGSVYVGEVDGPLYALDASSGADSQP